MAELTSRTQNPHATCRHKHSSRCATRLNVCCACPPDDIVLSVNLNSGLNPVPILLANAKSWCCTACQVIGVEQDQRYRAHPLSTVAVIPHHPDFVYPDPNIEIIVRSEGQRLSRSAKRYIRRVQYRPNEGYDTPSYRLPSELPGGTFWRSNILCLTFIPDTISQQVVERARGLRFGQSSSPIIGSRASTQSMRGNRQSSDIIPQIHVSSHRLAYITINAPHESQNRVPSSYRTTGYRTPAHPAPTLGGYHPSTIISPTALPRSWAQIATGAHTTHHATSSAERMPRARHEIPTSGSNRCTTPPAGSSADIAALERTWGLASPPDPASSVVGWTTDSAIDTATPDSSDLAGTARHAARLLDAFSRTSLPPDVVGITDVQKRLLTTVLTSVLTLTREVRVHAALASESLEALPVAEDVALRPDSACVVCYARLADMVLMPCWHLTLCEVCCEEIQTRAVRAVMRCPVCRADVVNKAKIYRS